MLHRTGLLYSAIHPHFQVMNQKEEVTFVTHEPISMSFQDSLKISGTADKRGRALVLQQVEFVLCFGTFMDSTHLKEMQVIPSNYRKRGALDLDRQGNSFIF